MFLGASEPGAGLGRFSLFGRGQLLVLESNWINTQSQELRNLFFSLHCSPKRCLVSQLFGPVGWGAVCPVCQELHLCGSSSVAADPVPRSSACRRWARGCTASCEASPGDICPSSIPWHHELLSTTVLGAGVPRERHGRRSCCPAWRAKAVSQTQQQHPGRMRTNDVALTWLTFTSSPSSSSAHSW